MTLLSNSVLNSDDAYIRNLEFYVLFDCVCFILDMINVPFILCEYNLRGSWANFPTPGLFSSFTNLLYSDLKIHLLSFVTILKNQKLWPSHVFLLSKLDREPKNQQQNKFPGHRELTI